MDFEKALQPLLSSIVDLVNQEIDKKLASIDLQSQIESLLSGKISVSQPWDLNSRIHHNKIDFSGFSVSGDIVKGGIIENFGSTGIEDRASHIQMTIMDHATAFEGPVYAPEIQIKGDLTVEGNVTLSGSIISDNNSYSQLVQQIVDATKKQLRAEIQTQFSSLLSEAAHTTGLDLTKITHNGKDVINGNQLGYHIVDTNIQRLGMVKDLQTVGETLLCNVLYVNNKRVGINTTEPSSVFEVWDEECKVVITKHKKDTAFIGTPRAHTLVIGSNNKESIVLDQDGNVKISELYVGKTKMKSAPGAPSYDAEKGEIAWNENPSLGGPVGWICLGGARWAKFGRIE